MQPWLKIHVRLVVIECGKRPAPPSAPSFRAAADTNRGALSSASNTEGGVVVVVIMLLMLLVDIIVLRIRDIRSVSVVYVRKRGCLRSVLHGCNHSCHLCSRK